MTGSVKVLIEQEKVIDDDTYAGNGALEEADLSSVEEISYDAFSYCARLKNVKLGKKLKRIKCYAFSNCERLHKIMIPCQKGLEIDNAAFAKTPLEEVDFGPRTDFSRINDNTLLIAGGRCPLCREKGEWVSEGLRCGACGRIFTWEELDHFRNLVTNCTTVTGYNSINTELYIPEGITRIETGAFFDNGITGVDLPDGLTVIGCRAFHWCDRLIWAEIPFSVKRLEHQSFCGTAVRLGTIFWFEYIGRMCFYGDLLLEEITIEPETRMIGESAFGKCTSLREITFDDGITILGEQAFEMTAIEKVELPRSLRIIRAGCFKECRFLRSVSIHEGLLTIEEGAFSNCTNLSEVKFPDSLMSIGERAFAGCTSLKKVVLPEGLRCANLSGVFDQGTEIAFV